MRTGISFHYLGFFSYYSHPCQLSLECHKTTQCLPLLTVHGRCVGFDVLEMLFISAEMAFLGGCHRCTMVDV